MGQKVKASEFVSFLIERIGKKDAYLMGATGQALKNLNKNSY